MGDEHTLVQQQRIRLPRRIWACAREVIDPPLFECRNPWDFTTVIEMAIQQQSLLRVVYDSRTQLFQFRRKRHLGDGDHCAAAETDSSFIEHIRIDMDDRSPASLDD